MGFMLYFKERTYLSSPFGSLCAATKKKKKALVHYLSELMRFCFPAHEIRVSASVLPAAK